MGMELVLLYNKIKKSWKIAFYTAFIGFLLVHVYKLTNYLPNHDSMFNIYSNQDMTSSGRWFLQYACGISSYFDLPWLNGLLCAVYVGLASVFITELFDMENPVVIGLSALILVGCPSTTETMFFEFTADGYFFGMVICAASACLSAKGTKVIHYVVSGVLLCVSLAIYQVYISFAAVLCACYIIDRLLCNQTAVKEAWKWVGRHVVIYFAAAASYYVIWKLILLVTGQQANSYQGINQVGKIQISTLLSGAVESVKNLFLFFLEWNILEHPITLYAVLNILYILAFVCIFVVAVIRNRIYKSISRFCTVLLFLVACIPVISIWCFLSEGVQYRPMMLHSACVLYIYGIIMVDKYLPHFYCDIVGLLIAVIIFNFGVMTNIAYSLQAECYEQSYYRGIKMIECIEKAKDNTVSNIAFVGRSSTEFESDKAEKIHILSVYLEPHLLYDHVHTFLFLDHTFGLDLPQASAEIIASLEKMTLVQSMESWPLEGSVQVIDGTLVIKLGEIE